MARADPPFRADTTKHSHRPCSPQGTSLPLKSPDPHKGPRAQVGQGLSILSFTGEETKAQTANRYRRGLGSDLLSPNPGAFPEYHTASRAPCQGSAHCFCKVTDSKYFRLYRALGLCLNYSTLPNVSPKQTHTIYVKTHGHHCVPIKLYEHKHLNYIQLSCVMNYYSCFDFFQPFKNGRTFFRAKCTVRQVAGSVWPTGHHWPTPP